jgi:hypothetical protein
MEEIVFGRPAAEAVVGPTVGAPAPFRWSAARSTLIRKIATSIPRSPRKIDGPAHIPEILLLAA